MRTAAAVSVWACLLVLAGASSAARHALDGERSASAASPTASSVAVQRNKKKFRRFFNFRVTGDDCLPSMSKREMRVPRLFFFGTFEKDPFNPDVSAFVGLDIFVCTTGFDPAHEVRVRMVAPDARVAELVLPAQGPVGMHFFGWNADFAAPLGLYTFEAQQGAVRARGSLDLGPAPHPVLNSRYFGVRMGESLSVFLSGFPASERVRIGVYRASRRSNGRCPGQRRLPADQDAYCFTGQVFKATIDANGNGTIALPARRSTLRPGGYALEALAPSVRGFVFGPQFAVCRAQHPSRYCSNEPELDGLLLP